MFIDVNKIFNPSLEDRIKETKLLLEGCLMSLENRNCSSCKHCTLRPQMIDHHLESARWCRLKNESCETLRGCDEYDVADFINPFENKQLKYSRIIWR